MKLIQNWQEVLTKAWSARLMVLAGLLSGAEVALPFFTDVIPQGAMAVLSSAVVMGAFIARLLAQKNMGAKAT